MEKTRLEAFSDGVLAIIITIMVLEMKLPEGEGWDSLLSMWPALLSYFVSFLFVAIYWVNHHQLFRQAETVNLGILWCNIAWLFVMSLIPFATAWVGNHPNAFVPLSFYFADMFLASVTFHLMYYLLQREHGIKPKFGVRSVVSLITYFLAAVLGGFSPVVSFIVVSLVSCWWIFADKSHKNEG